MELMFVVQPCAVTAAIIFFAGLAANYAFNRKYAEWNLLRAVIFSFLAAALSFVGMVAAQSLTVKTNEPVYRYFELAVVFPSWLFAFKAAGSPPKKSVVWAVVISILALLIDLYAVQFILFE